MQQVTNSCETFELSQVCIEDRSVVVEVCNAKLDEYFLVPKWIVNPNATCRNPRSDLLIPQSITFGENRSLPDWAPGTTQKALIETLSGVVSSDIGETLDVLSAFVWMSFLYPSFNELPILWLYSPSVSLRQLVKDVLRQLCFNGLEAKPYYLLSSVLFALKGHSVTLILNDPSEYPSSYRKAIFADRDRKECVYPFDANFTLPLFSPRIVVSHKGPDREYLGQCLAVPIRPMSILLLPAKHTLKRFGQLSWQRSFSVSPLMPWAQNGPLKRTPSIRCFSQYIKSQMFFARLERLTTSSRNDFEPLWTKKPKKEEPGRRLFIPVTFCGAFGNSCRIRRTFPCRGVFFPS